MFMLKPLSLGAFLFFGLVARPALGEQVPPKVVHPAPLVYPPDGKGQTAVVHLSINLDEAGQLTSVKVLSVEPKEAPQGFQEVALEHVRALHFSPARSNGKAIAAQLHLTLRIAPPPETTPPAHGSTPEVHEPDHAEQKNSPPPPNIAPAAPAIRPEPKPNAKPDTNPDATLGDRAGSFSARVRGALRQAERATSDFRIELGQLRSVPRKTAADLLTLAPGVLLTNEGGEGHAQRVFLRGFDAREGQDMEFTVDGVPINEVANAHGQGFADTHFLIPELVTTLRVIEGPFDPRQGDFSVAGSAEYHLGVPKGERGLRLSYRGGSFNSHRLLLLWAPDARSHSGSPKTNFLFEQGTFGAVELSQSDGYGQNRFNQRASAMAQVEGRFGETGGYALTGTAYATRYKSPGVIRQDDYLAGRKGFFDTYDPEQGGDSERHSLAGRIWGKLGRIELGQQVFLIYRDQRIRENFTGFFLDPQKSNQSPRGTDPQRGDLLDQATTEVTIGGRGHAQLAVKLLGLTQMIEVGYYARYDRNHATSLRLRNGTTIPYRTEFDFEAGQSNIAGYLDLTLHPLRWLTLRGGIRGDFFHFQVNDLCANKDVMTLRVPPPPDLECYSLDRYGYRNPTQRRTATGLAMQPRVTLQLEPLAGLFLTGSYGQGARSADPLFLGDGDDAPFASIQAAEGGALYHLPLGPLELSARAAYFYTHVDKDLIYNQTLGRNTLANGTTRMGILGAARLTGPWLDAAATVTWARATFDEDGNLVPYVPDLVIRFDGAGFGPLPKVQILGSPLVLQGGLGLTYVAPRPLPLSERGDAYVVVDASLKGRWRAIEAGLSLENLLDQRYRLSEFNYTSDFRSALYPTQVAARHFIAGPPFSAMATLTLYLDSLVADLRRQGS